MAENGKKRKQAPNVEVKFPPSFIKEYFTDKGKNLADFKKEVMDMYKGKAPVMVDEETLINLEEIVTSLGDESKTEIGINGIKFYNMSGINGRDLSDKIRKCSKTFNKLRNGATE